MADILKLKKKAADFEAKKQMDKAIAAYREVLEVYESGDEHPIDIPLYNRVGDLLQGSGNLPEAMAVWERAVDHYTDGGFYNLAIALCNKILRQSPGRAVVYYKLGKISAEKGFKADARENFLEYAGRMQKAGNLNEAFRALKEFADLVPDQDDVRIMLADQLLKAGRKDEAIEQLQITHVQLTREGRDSDAGTVAEKMRAIDPSVEPRTSAGSDAGGGGGLVFLDLDAPASGARRSQASRPSLTPIAHSKRVTKATEGLDILDMGMDLPTATPPAEETPSASPPRARQATPAPEPAPEPTPEPTPEPAAEKVAKRPTDHSIKRLLEPTATPVAPVEVAPVDDLVIEPIIEPDSVAGVERVSALVDEIKKATPTPPAGDLVIERTHVEEPPEVLPGPLPGLERTSFGMDEPPSRQVPQTAEHKAPATDDLPLIEFPSVPMPEPPRAEEPETPRAAEPELPATAERRVPPKPRRSADDTPLPETAERRVPIIETPEAGTAKGTPLSTVRFSDFGTFGETKDTPSANEPVSADALEIVSSESMGIEPFSDTMPDPSLVGDLPGPIFGPRAAPLVGGAEAAEARESAMVLANSVDSLRDRATETPDDWGLRRQLAEALLDDGQREAGIEELEVALAGHERDGDLDTAASIAEEIVRLAPKVIKYHQKRVEFAFRAADQRRLAEAYVELADALLGDGQSAKARVVYQRVLEISPDDLRAQAALETIAEAPVPEPAPAARRSTHAVRPSAAPKPKAPAKKAEDEEFVSLGDWLREEEEPKSTRMVVEEKEPTGDEQADFADMLRKFKQGVSDNVDDEDHEAHYDLGVAYKEMGLLDEAIGEFQKSLRGTANRVRSLEALGLCFVEKTQLPVAATILQRALLEPGVGDDSLVGVLYLLGTISEELHLFPDAKRYYQRVFAVDIQFRDVSARLNAVEKQLS